MTNKILCVLNSVCSVLLTSWCFKLAYNLLILLHDLNMKYPQQAHVFKVLSPTGDTNLPSLGTWGGEETWRKWMSGDPCLYSPHSLSSFLFCSSTWGQVVMDWTLSDWAKTDLTSLFCSHKYLGHSYAKVRNTVFNQKTSYSGRMKLR